MCVYESESERGEREGSTRENNFVHGKLLAGNNVLLKNTIEVLMYYHSNFSNIITIIDMIILHDELIIKSYDYIITNNTYII
jgi:hypothetical protein